MAGRTHDGDQGTAAAAGASLSNAQTVEDIARAVVESERSNTFTNVPVKVVKNSDGKTARLQPTVRAPVRTDKGIVYVTLPEIEAIVEKPGAGNTTLTFPIKAGNEGRVSFGTNAIESWYANGDVQDAASTRTHQLSDGMFQPGARSKPREIPDISTEGAEMRTDDGQHRTITHPENGVRTTVGGGKQVVDVNAKTGQVEVKSKTVTLASGDATAGRGANTENTADRYLNEQLKGLSARMGQVEKTTHALFDVTSRLRQLTQIRVPEVAQLAGLLNQAPGGLDAIVGAIEGKAQAYAQTQLTQALGMFLNPSIGGLGSVLGGGIEALIGALLAQIAKLIEAHPILTQVDDLERQVEMILARGAEPDVQAEQLQPVKDALAQIAKDNPAVAALQGLKDQLQKLQGQAGPGLNFLEPQKQLAQGVIKSLRLSEGG